MNDLAIPEPERCPLYAIYHAIVSEISEHFANRIEKINIRVDGSIERINTSISELQWAENCICGRC